MFKKGPYEFEYVEWFTKSKPNQTAKELEHQPLKNTVELSTANEKSTTVPLDGLSLNEVFVGARRSSEVAKLLPPNEFRLYYKLSKKIKYDLPLTVAYKSNQHKVFHFPVVHSNDKWFVDNGANSKTFPNLKSLIAYHKTFSYIVPDSEKVESFPVWRSQLKEAGVNKSSTSDSGR
ncbi:hypothetical protein M3Y94_00118800 [Aphelenchoides besseyi]|nr:hypothetical protein M3Y94_00118800 [Aphelenchoides besseyi]KAI6237442.1 hypothetical protein M3Y95_00265500 [Aphelenchoides besseyi]